MNKSSLFLEQLMAVARLGIKIHWRNSKTPIFEASGVGKRIYSGQARSVLARKLKDCPAGVIKVPLNANKTAHRNFIDTSGVFWLLSEGSSELNENLSPATSGFAKQFSDVIHSGVLTRKRELLRRKPTESELSVCRWWIYQYEQTPSNIGAGISLFDDQN